MADQIRFDDGSAYERMMGVWSQLVGTAFLDWLHHPEQIIAQLAERRCLSA